MKKTAFPLFLFIIRSLIIVGFFCFWELSVRYGLMDEFFVSLPSSILKILIRWMTHADIYRHIGITTFEAISGYIIGVLLGILFGFLFAFSSKISKIFDPFMALLNSLPRLTLAPLLVTWVGLGVFSKIALVVLLIFFLVFFNIYKGLKESDQGIVNNLRVLGSSKLDMVRYVYLPSIMSWLISSLRLSIGFAFVGAIVGEYLGSDKGIGYLIAYGKAMFKMSEVLGGVIIVVLIAGFIDMGLRRIEARYSYWKMNS